MHVLDLEKADGREPREELRYCRRKSGVAEEHVRVVQIIHDLQVCNRNDRRV